MISLRQRDKRLPRGELALNTPIDGVIPVMITPFTQDDSIDFDGLGRLVDWYIDNGADALFAVCQSSEMFFLSPQERRILGRFVVEAANGRVPVVVSGHVGDTLDEQADDLRDAADSGADAVILITNRLDIGGGSLVENTHTLLKALPGDLDLGFYECPYPNRRLLTDAELQHFAATDRFVLLKDVSCDLDVVKHRLALTQGTRLVISNPNAAIAWRAMQAGARGFCGIFGNFAPDLYAWLLRHGDQHPELAEEISQITTLGSMCEAFGYPVLAKLYHQRIGTFASIHTRSYPHDIHEKVWGVEPLLDNIIAAIEAARAKVRAVA